MSFIAGIISYIFVMIVWGIILLLIMLVSFSAFDILLGADSLSVMQ
jgi:hypothetical protein